MSDVKVGDKIEILEIDLFNPSIVKVGDVATIISIDGGEVHLRSDGWVYPQHTQTCLEGEYWKLLPTTSSTPSVEAPTINSEPFITIKGVEVGSSLERALNLVVAVYNGDDVRKRDYGSYTTPTYVREAGKDLGTVVRTLEDRGLDWYVLKSEDEAKLNKETLDKEIKELEDKLQELKTKRGD